MFNRRKKRDKNKPTHSLEIIFLLQNLVMNAIEINSLTKNYLSPEYVKTETGSYFC